jgi:hypothetical protein
MQRSLLLLSRSGESQEKYFKNAKKGTLFTPNNLIRASRRVKNLRIRFQGATGRRFLPINIKFIFSPLWAHNPLIRDIDL